MTLALRLLLTFALSCTATPALAHPPPIGIGGFWGGLLHPLFVPAHALAVLALGLLIGQQMPQWDRKAPLIYVTALAVGLGILTFGIVPRHIELALLLLALGSGGLIALGRVLPEPAGIGLALVTGLTIGLDSPPEVLSIREANFMLIGTGFGATILLILVVEIGSRLTRPWQRIGARVIGSWVAASAILVLALRLTS